MMNVPFLDLKAQHSGIREELQGAFAEVMDKNAFAGGPFVEKFESEFAEFCGRKYAVGVGSGTEALWLILQSLGIAAGDEVITVPNTFIATAEAISLCGATPVFIDVEPVTYTMDPRLLEAAITTRTRAIIPVHLYGQMADCDPILKIAASHGIPVLEDACQAHGAAYFGKKAGSLGVAGAFSFYPGKNLGSFGEAGAIVTDDESIRSRAKIIRDHGQEDKYVHSRIGWNARMDGIQGALLSVKLKHLEKWNDLRRQHAEEYDRRLEGIKELTLPREAGGRQHVRHIYSVGVPARDELMAALKSNGIGSGIHYPIPLHLQGAYRFLGYPEGSFPVCEKAAREALSLPMYPEITSEQIQHVSETIAKFYARRKNM
jgi:dTDP-4-amino-4,6-dideoxygalactose transaminase